VSELFKSLWFHIAIASLTLFAGAFVRRKDLPLLKLSTSLISLKHRVV